MARRAYWKGYLKRSLVTCPVALFPASSKTGKTIEPSERVERPSNVVDLMQARASAAGKAKHPL